jgi:DNA-binding response OmpR family regulator
MAMPTLDLISPDAALRHAVLEQLAAPNAWQALETPSLAGALEAWKDRTPEAILLDTGALDQNAPQLAKAVQARTPPALLFILGEFSSPIDERLVTEWFPKPLRLGYLLTRLHFYQQPHHHEQSAVYTLGPWTFTPRARQLTPNGGGKNLHLTTKESSLLEYLCQAEKAVARDELLAAVWGYDGQIDTHTLETHIYLLRRNIPEGHDLFLVENGCYRINPAWLTN